MISIYVVKNRYAFILINWKCFLLIQFLFLSILCKVIMKREKELFSAQILGCISTIHNKFTQRRTRVQCVGQLDTLVQNIMQAQQMYELPGIALANSRIKLSGYCHGTGVAGYTASQEDSFWIFLRFDVVDLVVSELEMFSTLLDQKSVQVDWKVCFAT